MEGHSAQINQSGMTPTQQHLKKREEDKIRLIGSNFFLLPLKKVCL